MSTKISIFDVVPNQMQGIIYNTKIPQTEIHEWSIEQFHTATESFNKSISTHGVPGKGLGKVVLTASHLLFWILNAQKLYRSIYPHPEFAFSSFLAERINDVWDVRPDLIGPGVIWAGGGGKNDYNFSEVLSRQGIMLDPNVLKDGPKQVFQRAFATKRCINLAASKEHFGFLEMMTGLTPSARAAVYAHLCTPLLLNLLCERATDTLIVDTRYAIKSNGVPQEPFKHYLTMNTLASRRLLTSMVSADIKSPQLGWASGCKSTPRDASGKEFQCALKIVAERSLAMVNLGYGLEGLRQLVGDVGTIVGYSPECVGEQSLAREFAAAFFQKLIHRTENHWAYDFNVETLLARHDRSESFLDGVLNYFVDSNILADDVLGTLDTELTDFTLRTAFKAANFPAGTIEGYEAMHRARAMKGVIAGAGTHKTECLESTGRRGMRV